MKKIPMLEPIYGGLVDQKKGINLLKSINYNNLVSIEMKQPKSIEPLVMSLKQGNKII